MSSSGWCSIVVLLCAVTLGSALSCYECDNCGPTTYEDRVLCQLGSVCAKYNLTMWVANRYRIYIAKGCQISGQYCEDIKDRDFTHIIEQTRHSFSGMNLDQFFPTMQADLRCHLCDTELCNSTARPYSSAIGLLMMLVMVKLC